ncbi:MAG: heme-copper oxidase subunit III [Caldilineales bacterium]|nr:heme-copper oxidase subunit III [Caldilineales bacterium]
MTVQTTHVQEHGEHAHSGISPAKRLKMNRLGLWLFILSEAFLFGGILVARFYLWGATRPHLDQRLGLTVTVVLLISSFFANRAEVAMKFGDRGEFLRSILVTIVLGTVFMFGVVGVEWPSAPVNPATEGEFGVYGAILFLMTGLHAFHVLTGVLLLAILAYRGFKGHFSAENHWAVEAGVVYWHFVDVVWVFFYPALYLMGTAVGPAH